MRVTRRAVLLTVIIGFGPLAGLGISQNVFAVEAGSTSGVEIVVSPDGGDGAESSEAPKTTMEPATTLASPDATDAPVTTATPTTAMPTVTTPATEVITLAEGFAQARTGDTIVMLPGNYTVTSTLSSSGAVSLRGPAGGKATVLLLNGASIQLLGTEGAVNVRNVNFKSSGGESALVLSGTNVIMNTVSVTGATAIGAEVRDARKLTVSASAFNDNPGVGLQLTRAGNASIKNSGFKGNGTGLALVDAKGVDVSENDFSDNETGIRVSGASSQIAIDKNGFSGTTSVVIHMASTVVGAVTKLEENTIDSNTRFDWMVNGAITRYVDVAALAAGVGLPFGPGEDSGSATTLPTTVTTTTATDVSTTLVTSTTAPVSATTVAPVTATTTPGGSTVEPTIPVTAPPTLPTTVPVVTVPPKDNDENDAPKPPRVTVAPTPPVVTNPPVVEPPVVTPPATNPPIVTPPTIEPPVVITPPVVEPPAQGNPHDPAVVPPVLYPPVTNPPSVPPATSPGSSGAGAPLPTTSAIPINPEWFAQPTQPSTGVLATPTLMPTTVMRELRKSISLPVMAPDGVTPLALKDVPAAGPEVTPTPVLMPEALSNAPNAVDDTQTQSGTADSSTSSSTTNGKSDSAYKKECTSKKRKKGFFGWLLSLFQRGKKC